MSKRTWVFIVIIAVVVVGVGAWSSVAKTRKTRELIAAIAQTNSDEAKVMDAMQQLRLRGASIGPRLVVLLNGTDTSAAFRAATLLGSIGYRDAAPDLMRALESEAPDTRGCAALALGKLGAVEATAALCTLAARSREELFVRTQCVNALALLAPKDPAVIKTLDAILAVHPPVPPEVPEGQKPPEPKPDAPKPPPDDTIRLRVVAARALGMIAAADGVDSLRAAADSDLEPSPDVRVAAAYALGDAGAALADEKGQKSVVEGLLKAMLDKTGDVRIAATYSLGKARTPESEKAVAGEALQKAATDEHYWVRRAARWSLGRMHLPVPPDEIPVLS